MRRFGPGTDAGRGGGDRLECETLQMVPHVLAGLLPDGKEDALTLVITRPVLVGFAEVSEDDRPVDGRDDLRQADVTRGAGERVSAPDAPFRLHETSPFQGQEDLLEVGLWESRAFGDVANRDGTGIGVVQGQAQKGPARIIASRRHPHGIIVGVTAGPDGDDPLW